MKILHIGISEHLGGIETYLFKIASNIDRREYQFDFLTYHGVTPCFYEELTALGCRFRRVTSRRENPMKFRKEFLALLDREHYDVVHCHLNTLSFTEPIDLALSKGMRVIAHSRNGEMIGSFLSRLLHRIHYHTLPRKKIWMLAVSDVAGSWMFGPEAEVTVLNNGVDLEKFHFRPEERARIRAEFGLGQERVIVHTGAFRPQKNHGFLVEIFARLHVLEPDTRLMLVGSGSLMEDVRRQVARLGLEDHVIFAGQRSDIAGILSAGDIFLFPSLYEGFPNALVEAEAMGLACLAADTITTQAKIPGLCRYLSLEEGPEFWARQLHECEAVQDRAGAADRIRAAALDVQSDVRRLTNIYQEIIAKS